MSEHLVWIRETLDGLDLRPAGEPETVKERPWALVVRVPTSSGPLWFKENRAGTKYEAALLDALPRWVPDRVLTPLAVDARRGWSLQPDGGKTVYDSYPVDDSAPWERLLADYAVLQRDLRVHVGAMLALGVPDQRPQRLSAAIDTLPVPDSVADYLPNLHELCQELAASPIPLSLQHDDLHTHNVFADGRFFDWGDSAVAHPFGVLLIALRVAGMRFEPSTLDRLRDAYLEPWLDLAPRSQLLREAQVAAQIAKVGRALSWQRAMESASPEQVAEWEHPVTSWLEELVK